MKPLFSVGEEVILKSIDRPECNGDAVVVGIEKGGTRIKCPHCNSIGNAKWEGYGYYLDIKEPDNCCTSWCQSALRKKYDPGMKFDELIQSLKSPEKQE